MMWVIGVLVIVGSLFFYQNNIEKNGKAYSNKTTLCQRFAQSYLSTVQKTDNITDYGSEKWQIAIDIETDMYNLCLTDLNRQAVTNFKMSAIEKYQK